MSQDTASTTMGDDANPQAESARSAVSPGELLRRARESLNLTISDLAGQTRLSRAVLDALEKNDFASLAMPVYVRGYFRKCAHVLNLPEDRLLQAYADWTGTSLKPQALPITVSEPPPEYPTSSRTPSWRYILVIAVVIGAALWWFGSGNNTPPDPTAQVAAPVTALEVAPSASEPVPLPLSLADQVAAVSPDAAATDPTVPAPAMTDAPAGSAVIAPASAQAPAGPNTLQLNITRTSWVEIYDNERKRLVYGLLNPGAEHRVTGKPPYQVVLGHPQGVRLSIGGKAIDLAPHTSGNGTARFEIEKP